jgi:hypothetical protein
VPDARDTYKEEAAELLRSSEYLQFLETAMGNRISFGNSAAAGLGVLEMKPGDEKAIAEVNDLCNNVEQEAKATNTTSKTATWFTTKTDCKKQKLISNLHHEKTKTRPSPTPPVSLVNPAMQEMINKGGSVLEGPAPSPAPLDSEEDKLKSFTFKIYESELAQIRAIQDSLPKRERISIHNFVVSAVKEKIEKGIKYRNQK